MIEFPWKVVALLALALTILRAQPGSPDVRSLLRNQISNEDSGGDRTLPPAPIKNAPKLATSASEALAKIIGQNQLRFQNFNTDTSGCFGNGPICTWTETQKQLLGLSFLPPNGIQGVDVAALQRLRDKNGPFPKLQPEGRRSTFRSGEELVEALGRATKVGRSIFEHSNGHYLRVRTQRTQLISQLRAFLARKNFVKFPNLRQILGYTRVDWSALQGVPRFTPQNRQELVRHQNDIIQRFIQNGNYLEQLIGKPPIGVWTSHQMALLNPIWLPAWPAKMLVSQIVPKSEVTCRQAVTVPVINFPTFPTNPNTLRQSDPSTLYVDQTSYQTSSGGNPNPQGQQVLTQNTPPTDGPTIQRIQPTQVNEQPHLPPQPPSSSTFGDLIKKIQGFVTGPPKNEPPKTEVNPEPAKPAQTVVSIPVKYIPSENETNPQRAVPPGQNHPNLVNNGDKPSEPVSRLHPQNQYPPSKIETSPQTSPTAQPANPENAPQIQINNPGKTQPPAPRPSDVSLNNFTFTQPKVISPPEFKNMSQNVNAVKPQIDLSEFKDLDLTSDPEFAKLFGIQPTKPIKKTLNSNSTINSDTPDVLVQVQFNQSGPIRPDTTSWTYSYPKGAPNASNVPQKPDTAPKLNPPTTIQLPDKVINQNQVPHEPSQPAPQLNPNPAHNPHINTNPNSGPQQIQIPQQNQSPPPVPVPLVPVPSNLPEIFAPKNPQNLTPAQIPKLEQLNFPNPPSPQVGPATKPAQPLPSNLKPNNGQSDINLELLEAMTIARASSVVDQKFGVLQKQLEDLKKQMVQKTEDIDTLATVQENIYNQTLMAIDALSSSSAFNVSEINFLKGEVGSLRQNLTKFAEKFWHLISANEQLARQVVFIQEGLNKLQKLPTEVDPKSINMIQNNVVTTLRADLGDSLQQIWNAINQTRVAIKSQPWDQQQKRQAEIDAKLAGLNDGFVKILEYLYNQSQEQPKIISAQNAEIQNLKLTLAKLKAELDAQKSRKPAEPEESFVAMTKVYIAPRTNSTNVVREGPSEKSSDPIYSLEDLKNHFSVVNQGHQLPLPKSGMAEMDKLIDYLLVNIRQERGVKGLEKLLVEFRPDNPKIPKRLAMPPKKILKKLGWLQSTVKRFFMSKWRSVLVAHTRLDNSSRQKIDKEFYNTLRLYHGLLRYAEWTRVSQRKGPKDKLELAPTRMSTLMSLLKGVRLCLHKVGRMRKTNIKGKFDCLFDPEIGSTRDSPQKRKEKDAAGPGVDVIDADLNPAINHVPESGGNVHQGQFAFSNIEEEPPSQAGKRERQKVPMQMSNQPNHFFQSQENEMISMAPPSPIQRPINFPTAEGQFLKRVLSGGSRGGGLPRGRLLHRSKKDSNYNFELFDKF